MTRRSFLASMAAPRRRRPNLLFLLTDDQRWDALGCAGNPVVQTPHIDSLARSGVRFGNAFVTTAICVTSRASIFTGLYARSHGIEEFARQFTAEQFSATYPAQLRNAGYRTGYIGKFGLDKLPLPERGFDFWRGFPGQGASFPQGEPGPHMLSTMTSQAREFLQTCRPGRPFCLSVSYKHPHADDGDPRQFLYAPEEAGLYRDVEIPFPKTAAPRYVEQLPRSIQRSEGRRRWAVRFSTPALYQESVKSYYRLCTGIDRSVGAVLRALDDRGLRDNTIVVYASDNGFYLAEHGLADKWFMHEESIRVPLIIHDPRPGALRGAVLPELALNIDIAPTLLDLAGVASHPPMQGRSLVPLLRGGTSTWRRDFFYEHRYRHNGWIPATEGVRGERWKYTRYIDETPVCEELFDLSGDRLEEENLAACPAHAARLGQMRRRHASWTQALTAWRPGAPWKDPD
jgi:arylsulfatase A-like enzyme